MVLKGHQQVVFIENLDAIRAEKLVWYSAPALKQHGVDLHAVQDDRAVVKIAKAA
jgi:hypothetical protein